MLTDADLDELARDTAEAGFEHLETLAADLRTTSVVKVLATYFQVSEVRQADDEHLVDAWRTVAAAAEDDQECLWTWRLACGCRFKGITGHVNPELICAPHRSK